MNRLYADENVWLPVVDGLRRRGWDITTVSDEGTLGATDREHLQYAAERDWLILTFDDDFLALVETADVDHAGIVFASQHGMKIGELVRRIDATLDAYDDVDLDDRILYA